MRLAHALIVLNSRRHGRVDVLVAPHRIRVHHDEINRTRQFRIRLLPVEIVVGDRDRAANRLPDLRNVLERFFLGQFVIGPGDQNLVAHGDRQHDVLVLVSQADSRRRLLRALGFAARPAVQPNAEQHLEPDLLAPDHFQYVLRVLISAVETDESPVLLQDLEVFENLRLSREAVQLRVLARAIARVIDAVALPFLHRQIGRQRRRRHGEQANQCSLHASTSPRRAFSSASIFTISGSSSG